MIGVGESKNDERGLARSGFFDDAMGVVACAGAFHCEIEKPLAVWRVEEVKAGELYSSPRIVRSEACDIVDCPSRYADDANPFVGRTVDVELVEIAEFVDT